jgi:hypothetical protein
VSFFRGFAAILLVVLGCWGLFWLAIFAAIGLWLRDSGAIGPCLAVGGWAVVMFCAAYFTQRWFSGPWRRADEA